MMSEFSLPLFPLSDAEAPSRLSSRDLLRQFFKHWRVVVLCLVVVTAVSWFVVASMPPFFESSAKVLVQTQQLGTPTFLTGITAYRETQDQEPVDRKIETEIQLFMSRSNVDAVVDRLNIQKSQLIQSPLDNLRARLPRFGGAQEAKKSAVQIHNQVVSTFLKALSVEPLRSKTADTTSNVFEARFASVDKELAPRALTALLEQYLRFGAQHNRELGESTFRLVDSKVREEADSLKTLDDEIEQLNVRHATHPDVPIGTHGGGEIADTTLPNPRNATQSSLGLLKTQAMELQAKLEDARQSYTDDAPPVRHLTAQLQALQQRLRTGAEVTTELDGRIERLERQRALSAERVKELQTKRDQIELYLQLNPVVSDTRIVTEPPLQPDKPNIKIKLVFGLLGPIVGLLLGLMFAGLREYFDHRLQDAADVKRYLGLDTLAVVPRES